MMFGDGGAGLWTSSFLLKRKPGRALQGSGEYRGSIDIRKWGKKDKKPKSVGWIVDDGKEERGKRKIKTQTDRVGCGRWKGEMGTSSIMGSSRPKERPVLQYCRLFEDRYKWACGRMARHVFGEEARKTADD